MAVSFERAAVGDAEALVSAAVAAFHHDSVLYPELPLGGPPGYDSPAVMRQKIVAHETYKIVEGERIIGGLVIVVQGGGYYHLDLIFIAPEHHDRGIGTQAMQFIESIYPAIRWTLNTPNWAVRNIHFYEKLGYVKTGTFEDDGMTLIMYEKRSPESEL